jgi:adenosylcobinamide kinase/adenosylcobinamide-phosphate guanylyltransferase
MPRRTLVLGGVRSGKSRWAEQQFANVDAVEYVATAAARDDEDWADRIAAHRDRRPPHWKTTESLDLVGLLGDASVPRLVDDLGNWVARTIDGTDGWEAELTGFRHASAKLVEAWSTHRGRVVLVSNEVGSGVHPESRVGRIFRDELGRLNAELAATADEVVLIVAGIPMWLRGSHAAEALQPDQGSNPNEDVHPDERRV